MQQQQEQEQQQPQYYQTAPPPPTLPQQTFNRHELSGALSPSFQFYPPYDPAKDETLVNLGDEKKTELVAYITEAKTEPEFNQQGGPGLSKKVTRYKINFKTNSDKFMQKEAIVWRRFSDFVQLHDRLLESHRGIFHSSETGEIDKKTRRRSVRASAETHVAKLSRKVDQTPIASHIYGIKSVFDAARFTAVARMARTGSSRRGIFNDDVFSGGLPAPRTTAAAAAAPPPRYTSTINSKHAICAG